MLRLSAEAANRMTLARSIAQLGFPKPVELGANRIAWNLDEVRDWLASRPRRTPKVCGGKKSVSKDLEAPAG